MEGIIVVGENVKTNGLMVVEGETVLNTLAATVVDGITVVIAEKRRSILFLFSMIYSIQKR